MVTVRVGGGACPYCGHHEYLPGTTGTESHDYVATCSKCGRASKASCWHEAEAKRFQAQLKPAQHVHDVTAEASLMRDGQDDIVRVSLTNNGALPVLAYRFKLAAPEGLRFNRSYVGTTGTHAFDWSDLGESAGGAVWNIEINSLSPGARVALDFALLRTTQR